MVDWTGLLIDCGLILIYDMIDCLHHYSCAPLYQGLMPLCFDMTCLMDC